ncbi:hypothetical protein F4861DRAFT_146473 [Xylaria intraflava]|nr:hypothetical protein F4861DRAFT_146473 [Xylaria intraflava]
MQQVQPQQFSVMEKSTRAKLHKLQKAQKLQQIRVATGSSTYTLPKHDIPTEVDYPREHDEYQASLLSKCPAETWPHHSYRSICPRPILFRQHHQQQLKELSAALTTALNDIVKRWWIDQDARFSERMPLEQEEEDLLRVSPELLTISKMRSAVN